MALLTKEQILGATDITTEIVSVPEWSGEVKVKGLTGKQRGAWQQSLRVQRAGKQDVDLTFMNVSLCALCIVDDDDKRMFGDADLLALAEKGAAAIERVAKVAMRLSGLDEADRDALLKDSKTTPTDAPSSG